MNLYEYTLDSLRTIIRILLKEKVFLSYSHKDSDIAQAIYNGCTKRDLKVFYDFESLQPGEDFLVSVSNAILEASEQGCVVVIVSKNSMDSGFVLQEIAFSMTNSAYILPIIVDDVELSDEFRFLLARYQWVRLNTPVQSDQIDEIIDRIEYLALSRLNGE